MIKYGKRILTVILSAALSVSVLAGCSSAISASEYSTTVAATLGDTPIYLDEALYYLRSDQYYYEWLYTMVYGTADIWDMEISTGLTMADSMRNDTMTALRQTYILMSHAEEMGVALSDSDMEKIEAEVDEVLESSDEKLLESMGADRDRLIEIYSNNAIANLVWKAVADTADLDIDDEEVRCVGVSYVLVAEEEDEDSDEDETAANEDEDSASLKVIAQEVFDLVRAGETIDDAAAEYDLTAESTSYFVGDTYDEGSLGATALDMSEGEVRLIRTEDEEGWYVVYLDSEMDETATQSKRAAIVTERQDAVFEAQYAVWQDESEEFSVVSKVWDNISFETIYFEEEEDEAAVEEDETAEETEEESGTEEGVG